MKGSAVGLSLTALLDSMHLIEFDFRSILNVDLEDALPVKSWRWFVVGIRGLLAHPDSLLSASQRNEESDG